MTSRLVAVVLGFALAAPAWGGRWVVDPERSTIGFVATFEGAEFEGRFVRYDARLHFDPDHLADSRFEVNVDVGSADTGSGELNEGMLLPDWFHTARFPQATFVTSQIRHDGGDRFVAVGTLTIKGISRDVALPFSWRPGHGGATITGEATLDRMDFRVGEGEWSDESIVGAAVKVYTRLALSWSGS